MDLTQYKPLTNILPLHNQKQFDFDKLRCSLAKPVPKPPAIISIFGEMIASPGYVTALAGAAKSGKSALMTAILSGALALPGDGTIDTLGVTVAPNPDRKAVVVFDSEQSEYNHYKSFETAYLRSGRKTEADFFHSFSIRSYELSERKVFIEQCLGHFADISGGIFMFALDGLSDLVSSVNNEQECNDIVDWAEKLCIRYDCPMLTVLHFNPNSDKERGQLGSQLQRKCESVLSIVKEQDTGMSQITAKFTRNSDPILIPAINFEYDRDKRYHVTKGIITQQNKMDQKEAQKKAREEAKAEQQKLELREEFTKIVKNCGLMNYTELRGVYAEMTGRSTQTAERKISTAKAAGILTVSPLGKYSVAEEEKQPF